MKKKHMKSFSVICSVAVLAVIGSTMAYFTSTDQVTNQLIGSRFDITLTETKWDPTKAREIVPGDELDKNPRIVNNEKTPGYVFLRVTVPCDTQMVDNDDGTPLGSISSDVPMYKFMVKYAENVYFADETFTPAQLVNSHWRLVKENETDTYTAHDTADKQYVYVYAYAQGERLTQLNKGETTEPLFDKLQLWNFNEDYDPDVSHSVKVEALGIQADLAGYSPEQINEIWQILDEGGG